MNILTKLYGKWIFVGIVKTRFIKVNEQIIKGFLYYNCTYWNIYSGVFLFIFQEFCFEDIFAFVIFF